jgi:hypothetical protein
MVLEKIQLNYWLNLFEKIPQLVMSKDLNEDHLIIINALNPRNGDVMGDLLKAEHNHEFEVKSI